MRSKVRGDVRFGDDYSAYFSASTDGGVELNTDALVDAGVKAGGDDAKKIAGDIAAGASIGGLIGNAIPIPGIGAAIGATIGAVAGAVVGVVQFLNKPTKCNMHFPNGVVEIHDYPQKVKDAAQWIHDNMDKAVSYNVDDFYNDFSVLQDDFIVWENRPGVDPNWQNCVNDTGMYDAVLKKLPGAKTLLRTVQIPAAAALAAATPELIALYKVTFPQTFPALWPEDIAKIAMKVQPLLDAKIHQAQLWISAQPLYPTFDQVHAQFSELVPADINRALSMTSETPAQNQARARQIIGSLNTLKRATPQDIISHLGPAKLLTQADMNAAAGIAPPKKEHWWQILLEKIHLRKKPIPVVKAAVPVSKPVLATVAKFQKL